MQGNLHSLEVFFVSGFLLPSVQFWHVSCVIHWCALILYHLTLIRDCDAFVILTGALQDVLHLHDVLARVALARLCHTISRARALDGNWTQNTFGIYFLEIFYLISFLYLLFLQRGLILNLSSTPCSINSFLIPVKGFVLRQSYAYWESKKMRRGFSLSSNCLHLPFVIFWFFLLVLGDIIAYCSFQVTAFNYQLYLIHLDVT